MDKLFRALLVFTPIAIGAHFLSWSPLVTFFLAALAIVPLAKFIGEATEVLAVYTGSAVGGLLNATFGNATELLIGIFALRAGLVEVVKASITGSILGNLLLVLGMAMFAGGLRHKLQTFNRTAAMASALTLLLAVIALVMPAIFLQTAPDSGLHVMKELSVSVALGMFIIYIANLFFMLRTHKHLYLEEVGKVEAKWSVLKSTLILLVSTIAVAWASEILVGSMEPVLARLGWTELFVGVVVVAIVGNAAEHASAILMAVKNRMDLALQVAIGSTMQIAMLVAPLLVIISLFFQRPMLLLFNTFELVAIILAVLVTNAVVEDGESNWLEGLQLMVAYAIMAVVFFFHP